MQVEAVPVSKHTRTFLRYRYPSSAVLFGHHPRAFEGRQNCSRWSTPMKFVDHQFDCRVELRVVTIQHQSRVVRHFNIRANTVTFNSPFPSEIKETDSWHK